MHRVAKIRKAKPGMHRAQPKKWVAPVGGWRTDVPLAAMPPDASPYLVNWFPEAGYVRARNGSTVWASGISGAVNTVIPFMGATNKMFAAAGANIYDVTSPGTVGAPVVSGQKTDHYSYTQMATGGGFFLFAANGTDALQEYNGTSWGPSTYTGTGLDLTALSVCLNYKSRLYFIQKNSTIVWFSGTDGVSGALTALDVGPNMKFGGTLVAMGTWTTTTVSGPLIFLCIITSNGEVVIFQGSDPSDSTNWALIGTCKMSSPIGGDRCCYNSGGDLAIMTMDGIIPVSKAFFLDPAASDTSSVTAHISPTWLATVQSVGTTSNQWQFITFPHRRMGIVNVPDPTGFYQFVMNTETKSWTKFTGLNAQCWAVWQNDCFFGDANGNVLQAETGSADNGAPIDCVGLGAWDFGDGVTQRQSSTISIMAETDTASSILGGVSADFNVTIPTFAATSPSVSAVAEWDVADWDIATWGGVQNMRLIGATAGAVGVALAPVFRAIISGSASNFSNTYIYGGSILVETGMFI